MKLCELFELLPKSKHPASYGCEIGKYPFFTSSNTIDSFVDDCDFNGEYLIIGDGGTANCKYINSKFSVSDHNYVLKPLKGVNAKLMYYFLINDDYKALSKGFKGVGIKNISRTYIENIEYNKKSTLSDDEIVHLLDNISLLLEKEKHIVQKYDELIKSRFILQEIAV